MQGRTDGRSLLITFTIRIIKRKNLTSCTVLNRSVLHNLFLKKFLAKTSCEPFIWGDTMVR